jgi:hypothetical protein
MGNQIDFYWYSRAISYLICIPVFIGLNRFSKIDPSFRPFYLVVFCDFFTEVLYEILSRTIQTNSISYNFYNLVVFYIIVGQFIKWGLLKTKQFLVIFGGSFVLGVWLFDNLIINSLWDFNSYNILVIASLLCFFSLSAVSKIHFNVKREKTRNIMYAIAFVWVVKYLLVIISEISWFFFNGLGARFNWKLTTLVFISGGLINIAYAVIALWIPKKREYSWLSR